MSKPSDSDLARKGRTVALVIAATILIWLAAQWVGGQLAWPVRYVFLFDFAAIGALIWALVVSFQIWRARRDNQR